MVNKVDTEYWVYGEYGEGFGTPRNVFFTTEVLTTSGIFITQPGHRILNGAGQT